MQNENEIKIPERTVKWYSKSMKEYYRKVVQPRRSMIRQVRKSGLGKFGVPKDEA